MASGTIPLASISAYIRNVVSGVRSSCVTLETNAARRSLSVITPCNKNAAAVLTNMKKMLPQLTAANLAIDWYDPAGNVSATCDFTNCAGVNVRITGLNYQWLSPIGFANHAAIPMPQFSTYLPREIMGQDPNSNSVCS